MHIITQLECAKSSEVSTFYAVAQASEFGPPWIRLVLYYLVS